jgi:hypothetical protein
VGSVTVSSVEGIATLSLTGNCTLQLSGSIAINSGGRFVSTQADGIRPTVTWWYTDDRYSFRVNSGGRINVNDLTFNYVDGDGLCIMSGATIDGINNLYFGINTGVLDVPDSPAGYSPWTYTTALNIRLGASATVDYTFVNVRFASGPTYTVTTDATYAANRLVQMSQAFGGGPATENDREAGQQEPPGTPGHSIKWLLTLVWTGTSSSDWGIAGNWSPGQIPALDSDVRIVVGANPCYVATGTTRFCKSMLLESGAIEIQGTGVLEVNQDFTRTGGIFGGTGTVRFVGNTSQSLSPGGMTFAQMEVNKGAEAVSIVAATTVSGNVTVTAGTLAVGTSSLTVQGTLSGVGNITISTGTVTVSDGGNINWIGTITFTGAGELRIRTATVTSIGTLAGDSGWVVYDSATVNQTVYSMTYPTNLRINRTGSPSPPTASLSGATTVSGQTSVLAGTLAFAGQTMTCNGDVTVAAAGTLSLTGASTLYMANSKVVTINGKLYAQGTSPKPTITHTGAGSDRFSLVVNGQIEVDGLNFSWATQNGLEITSFATIVALRNVRFENASLGGRHLTVFQLGNSADSLPDLVDCPGSFFDLSFGASPPGYNVYLVDTTGGADGIVVMNFDGSGSVGAGAAYEFDNDGANGDAFVNWVGVTLLAGSESSSGDLQGIRGFASEGTILNADGWYSLWVAVRTAGGSYLKAVNGTTRQEVWSYTVNPAWGNIVGPIWVSWQNSTTEDVIFGTSNGRIVIIRDTAAGIPFESVVYHQPAGCLEVTSPVIAYWDSSQVTYNTGLAATNNSTTVLGNGTAWLANVLPEQIFSIVIGATTYNITIASVNTNTQLTLYDPCPNSGGDLAYAIKGTDILYFGGRVSSVPDTFRIFAIRRDTGNSLSGFPTAAMTRRPAAAPSFEEYLSGVPGSPYKYLHIGTLAVDEGSALRAHVMRLNVGGAGTDKLYGDNTPPGEVIANDVVAWLNLDSSSTGFLFVGGKDGLMHGIDAHSDDYTAIDPPPPWPLTTSNPIEGMAWQDGSYVYFANNGGRVYVRNPWNGNTAPNWVDAGLQPFGDTSAMKSGVIVMSDYVYVGNENGKVYKISVATAVPQLLYNFGLGVQMRTLSYNTMLGKLMIGTDRGTVYYIDP